ncbi:MAG TPA: sterol desaturase family protein [Chryseosolibacter sp.]|nr:sterol desaturase family protein [Chryseosolibacter sp.]
MTWLSDPGISGPILFIGYFLLYGLEYFFPLVIKKSRHFWTNASLAVVLILINFVFTSLTLGLSEWVEVNNFGFFNNITIGIGWQLLLSIIFLDFWAGYLVHFIFHQYAFLWHFHSIHHSDNHVDVTTTFRQHPVESLIRIGFNLSGMMFLGIPSWMLLIYLTLSTIHAQIEHANIRLPDKLDRLLQYIIVTPNMHKIHHSRYQHETDTNYSNIFSWWDRMFRTYASRKNYTDIQYGLDFLDEKTHYSFWDLVRMPFRFFTRTQRKS